MEQTTAIAAPRSRIDWTEVHRRLDRATAVLLQATEPTTEEKKKVLKTRAMVLARELKTEEGAREQLDIIEFLLAHECYAIESAFVREVYPLKELTPLPGTPPFLRGIINVRGRIVCVIDLKKFFNLPEKGLTDLNKIIIIGNGEFEFGLLADAVAGANRIAREQIQPSLPTLTGVRLDYLKGITGGCLVILDAAKILADPRLMIRGEAQT
ncbi:MAG TPA: chemotaxis protein CheW [Candidatus Angelobacter sp.]|nr:chemotaxis protein CheW [Candidatus Angelobacter sp.]